MQDNGVRTRAIKLAEATPHPENYNEHDTAQVARLRGSLAAFGYVRRIVVQEHVDGSGYTLVAGHGVATALEASGYEEIEATVLPSDWSYEKVMAYLVADNELAKLAQSDNEQLARLLQHLEANAPELVEATGYDDERLNELLESIGFGAGDGSQGDAEPQIDRAEELRQKWGTELGQLWQIGEHRLIVGDCTDRAVVERVMGGERAALCHADPPYGMGKEKDGIANDNLYRDKLDAFQMMWWRAQRPFLADNGSAYIWGNAEDLWRLWYCGGLKDSERLTLRNEVVWDKREDNPTMLVSGVPLESRRMYQPTERALFFMLGEQGFNNNADSYWEGWEPVRSYLENEMKRCGWTVADLNRITGTQMGGHWVTRSQWGLITEEHYKTIQKAAREHDAFKREHDAFKREHDELKREHDELKREFYATRAYFDNTHDNMTDVWQFQRVTGDDRHNHATPKPVEMIARAIKSSTPAGAAVYVPFAGTCPEIIACQNLSRRCRAIEISPAYCAVILERMKQAFGITGVLLP